MQHNAGQQDFNKQGGPYMNPYPPMYPNQAGTCNPYPPQNFPPPYAQYPQQSMTNPGYGMPGTVYVTQTHIPQQQTAIMVPIYRPFWNNLTPTIITSSLRNFLTISGLLYLVWGILAIGLEIGIIIHSSSTYYRGLWMGGFLIGGGIHILVSACQASYVLLRLVRMSTAALVFCILGAVFSIVNYVLSTRCDDYPYLYYNCDEQIATSLKIAILIVSIMATAHTIVNMVVASNAHKKTVIEAASGVPRL